MEEKAYNFLKDLQFSHWWFKGKSAVIVALLEKYAAAGNSAILDIGSGFGALIPVLKKFGAVDALESHKESHERLKELGAAEVFDIPDFPENYPPKRYDLVCLFDVLEHLEDDVKALGIIRDKLLKPGGKCMITAPAYMWLWSEHDEAHKHYRRYTKTGLKRVFDAAGFKAVKISYFMTLLFPFAAVQRLLLRQKCLRLDSELKMPGETMNGVMEFIFSFERHLINKINLPYGLSIIAVAEKNA